MRILRVFMGAVLAVALGGCVANKDYFVEAAAPPGTGDGRVDPRLALTRATGRALSPVIRNIRAPHGAMYRRDGLDAWLRDRLRPLDIVLIRSRPAATRLLIPGHFTHGMVWLGTPAEMERLSAFDMPEFAERRRLVEAGRTIIEASNDSVRLSPLSEMTDVDEILVLRVAGLGPRRIREKYAALAEHLGDPFDYNFDLIDERRFTCVELIAHAFPETRMPRRYTAGRYALVPDDLARNAVAGRGLSVVALLRPDGERGFSVGGGVEVAPLLSDPKPAPTAAKRC